MKRFIAALALVTAASVGIAGCGGDDDDEPSGTAGKGSTGGEPGSNGGEPASNGGEPGSTGGAPSGNVACDPAEDTVCQNEGDCAAVKSGEARMAAGVCGQGECLGATDNKCAIACIQRTVDLSAECADCYGAAVACTAKMCFMRCISDPEADDCKACQVEMGCREAFNTCSGLPE